MSAAEDETVRLWRLDALRELFILQSASAPRAIGFRADGSLFVLEDQLYSVYSGAAVRRP